MIVEPFKLRFMPEINRWLKARDHTPIIQSELPDIGYIAFSSNIPVAVGFLRKVEGSLGMIDSMSSNPVIEKIKRDEGLDLVTKTLVFHAKRLKMNTIFAHTKLDCIVERSKKHGFFIIPRTLIAIKLEDE